MEEKDQRLKTRHVFIDTSIFVAANFDYRSTTFNQFLRLTRDAKIFVHLTDITVREVESNIRERAADARRALQECRGKARILRNLGKGHEYLFADFDEKAVGAQLRDQFNGFLTNARVDILQVKDVSAGRVFDQYFALQPPFGQSKKKHEFPDAFVIQILRAWCEENVEMMYVISNDGDMVEACSGDSSLISLQKLEEFLNLVTREDAELSSFAFSLLHEHLDEIKEKAMREFELLGFILEDQEGMVEEVSAESVEVLESFLMQVDARRALFELTARVAFNAEVGYENLVTAGYDPEEGRYFPIEFIEGELDREEEVPVEVVFSYKTPQKPETAHISYVRLNVRDVLVRVEDDTPY